MWNFSKGAKGEAQKSTHMQRPRRLDPAALFVAKV
jgi:hypothetical protein